MINRSFFLNIFYIIILTLLQVFIFNNINFQQVATPFVYVVFILGFATRTNHYAQLFWAFLLGICIDFFDTSLGIHAFSLVTITYLRPLVLRMVSKSYSLDPDNFNLKEINAIQLFVYALILVFVHHLIIFCFYDFGFTNPLQIIQKTTFSTILSMIFVSIIYAVKKPAE